MARADKAATVAEMLGQVPDVEAPVLTEYRGLTVSQLTQLRRSLGEPRAVRRGQEHPDRDRGQDAGVTAIDEQGPRPARRPSRS
jgi:large subunit ribosomal protein L10